MSKYIEYSRSFDEYYGSIYLNEPSDVQIINKNKRKSEDDDNNSSETKVAKT